MRDSFDCELRVFIQYAIKESQEKEYAMNNSIRDHTPFARARARDRKHARVLNLTYVRSTCIHVPTAVDR